MKNVNVYAHITAKNHSAGNLGDKMGYLIVEKILQPRNVQRLGMRDVDIVSEDTFAIVGSLVQVLANKPVNIIGGGLINPNPRKYNEKIKIHGVRGFLTKALILRDAKLDVPVIGDPGLLLSWLYQMPEQKNKKPLGFIVHKVDRDDFIRNFPDFKDLIIDNYLEPEEFVKQLSQYQAVASTSLHGCVFCHAYGIPVKPFFITDEVIGGDFKFSDYYSSLGICAKRQQLSEYSTESDILKSVLSFQQPSKECVQSMQERQLELITLCVS